MHRKSNKSIKSVWLFENYFEHRFKSLSRNAMRFRQQNYAAPAPQH
jgi:hypothetical protein